MNPEYFVTLTLCRTYSDADAIEAFSFFLKSLLKLLNLKEGNRGIAFIERTWKNAHYEGQLHLHALLTGVNENVRADGAEEYICKLAANSAIRLKDKTGRQMTDGTTLNVQRVYSTEGLSGYVTKDVTRRDDDRVTHIYLITNAGLTSENKISGPDL